MSESNQQPRQIRKRVGRNVFDTPPRISVVIMAYNRARFVRETVDSVLAQKYREHEIIVVNDGSDDTPHLERELKMRMDDIIYIRQRHAGEGAARNTGVEHARGDIIAFINAGDVWQPDFLASQYVYLERHALDLVYSDAALFGTHSVYRHSFSEKYPSDGEVTSLSLLERRCNILMSGTVVRRSVLEKSGMFESEDVPKPGFHLWLRMAKAGMRIGYQKKELAKLRVYREDPSPEAMIRIENERSLYERIRRTIELSDAESKIVDSRLAELDAALAVEQGHNFLQSGDYTEAVLAFRVANRHQPSLKLTAITWLARISPKAAARYSESSYPTESVQQRYL